MNKTTIRGCRFDQNASNGAGLGGAIHLQNAQGVIERTSFSQNSAKGLGGAIRALLSSTRIVECDFRSNTASEGGGLSLYDCSMTIAGCTFSMNRASLYGGGVRVYAVNVTGVTMLNCSFSRNYAGSGGGVFVGSGTASIFNSILWGNIARLQPQIYVRLGATITVARSNVTGNWPGTGNSASSPLFVSVAAGDLHLQPTSPCIDSGDNTRVPSWLRSDLDGRLRFYDDPATVDSGVGTPPLVDRGAYEYGSPAACPADCDGDGICDADEIGLGGDTDLNGNGIPDQCDGKASAPDVDQGSSVTLLPAAGSGNRTQEPVVDFTNVSGPNNASIVVVQSGSDLNPGAGGFGTLGKTVTIETPLQNGEFWMRVSLPISSLDLGGASWNSVDLLYFDVGTQNWELAASGNTQNSPGHGGPIGDRFAVSSTTVPPLSGDLGDYGVYWHPTLRVGFVWANVDHTTDFSGGLPFGVLIDCNENGIDDLLDIESGFSTDCNGNLVPDECDLASGFAFDCDGDGVLDECELGSGLENDCNENGIPDSCDIASGTSQDHFPLGGDGIPDECRKIQVRQR
jgi:predicted outer membrane repeat protein